METDYICAISEVGTSRRLRIVLPQPLSPVHEKYNAYEDLIGQLLRFGDLTPNEASIVALLLIKGGRFSTNRRREFRLNIGSYSVVALAMEGRHIVSAEKRQLRSGAVAADQSPAEISPWIEFALRVALPRSRQDEVIGDLLEEYCEDILPVYGRWAARGWLLRHSLSNVIAALQLRRMLLIAAMLDMLRRLLG